MKQIITSFLFLLINLGALCQSEAILINESFENMLMPEVFDILKEKYQLKLAYDYESIQGIRVTQKIKAQDLESALTILFSNTDLEYQLVENNRVLVRKIQNLTTSGNSSKLQKCILQGKIIDAQSHIPLAYATIYCPSSKQGSSTDKDGNFSLVINSANSKGTISIQYLGYISKIMSWKKGDKTSNLLIKLHTKTLDFKEITILEKVPVLSLNQSDGAMVFRASQISTLPSFVGGNDIFRNIQLLPGISATDDLSSEIKIRGSNGDENMVILDGITLYKVDHYFGIFSAINPNIIDQVKVYKNAFPVEYGGRTAGVIDLSTHQVVKPKINGGLQIDLLTSSAYLGLPISDNMGLFIGGRTTNKNVANTDLFTLLLKNEETGISQNNLNLVEGNSNFRFYDVNAKWIWTINSKATIATNFFRGYDKFEYGYQRELATHDTRIGEITNTGYFNEMTNWNNQGASLQLNYLWNKRIQSDINFTYSSYNDSQIINSSLIRESPRLPSPRPGVPPLPPRIDTTFSKKNSAYNSIKGLELNVKNQWEINQQQQLTFGYHLVDNEVSIIMDVDNTRPLNISKEGSQHSIYLQYDLKNKSNFNIGLGLRNTYYTITHKNYLSPRLNLSYKISDNLKLKSSWSKYNQFLRQNYREDRFGRSYEFWVLGDEGNRKPFPVSSSKQWMAGFNFIKGSFELDVEAYYKNMDGIIEFASQTNGFNPNDIAPSPRLPRIYQGTGISKGIDVLLKKSSGDYTGWIAYTISKTTHSFPKIANGKAFPSQDDRRHQLKWVNQYRYKQFNFSAVYIYSTGRPYTDLYKIVGERDREQLKPEERISYLADYHRIDVGVSYRFNWGTSKAKVGLSIFNLLDRKNVKYRQSIYSIPNQRDSQKIRNAVIGSELEMLDFTPNISFSLEF